MTINKPPDEGALVTAAVREDVMTAALTLRAPASAAAVFRDLIFRCHAGLVPGIPLR